MLFMAFVFTIVLFVIVFPNSSVGRFVAGLFIRRGDKPLSLARIVALVVMAVVVLAFTTAFPLDLVLLMDFGAYTELMVALVLVVSQVRLRQVVDGAVRVFRRVAQTVSRSPGIGRAVRAPRMRRPTSRGKDNESSDADGRLAFA